jgi:hypothetical protein
VRDVDGTMVDRVERDEDGRVTVERAKFIGAGR